MYILIFMFLFPVLVIFLKNRNVKLIKFLGPVAVCYGAGLLVSLLPSFYDKALVSTVASVIIALAIPLVLFGFDIGSLRYLAKRTTISIVLLIVSVMTVSSAACVIAQKCGLENAPQYAGVATGLYIGGTPNLFAVGNALLKDIALVNLANISDVLFGGLFFFVIITVGKNAYMKFLSKASAGAVNSGKSEVKYEDEYDFSGLLKSKRGLLRLIGIVFLAILCLGAGVGLEYLVNGNLDGSLFIIITVSVLGLVFGLFKKVRAVKGSYQIGQYLILVFSLGLSMSMDLSSLVKDMLPVLAFFSGVQVVSMILHFLLCKIFKIDGGTALITGVAGIYGPPFIAPVANAYKDKSLIVPGIICGTFGLAVGNLLGLGLGGLLIALI